MLWLRLQSEARSHLPRLLTPPASRRRRTGTRLIAKLNTLAPFIVTKCLRESVGKRFRNPPPSMIRSFQPLPSVQRLNHHGVPLPSPASSAIAEPTSPNNNATERSDRSANRVAFRRAAAGYG